MKCPNCDLACVPYMDMETVAECPKCKNLFTSASGDDVEILRFSV